MAPQVHLHVTIAGAQSKMFSYSERCTVVVGRAADCDIQVPADERQVSRRHCVFDVDPPVSRIRDLGSRNGTYVNGVRVEALGSGAHELTDGDEIRAGTLLLRVSTTGDNSPAPSDTDAAFDSFPAEQIDRYTFIRELGRGAQGIVYLARQQDSGEALALKVLRPETSVHPDAVNSFLREIRNTVALRHPNLVQFQDAGSTGELLFFACEYCEGGDLAQRVTAQEGPLPPDDAVALTLQVLDGLTYAHHVPLPAVRLGDGTTAPARGLVHRDLKPQNILLSSAGPMPIVKIADFGLAKAFERAGLSDHTRTGARGGSLAFMPRAQIVNFKYARPAVDVWASAACLYWTLTRSTARDFPDGTDPLRVVLREPAVPIRKRNASIPARLAALIDDILAVEDPREGVTPSADEFNRALKETL
ncbi:protein kinase domain-containing protein [Streptomyces sp. NPDC055059]|uniref:protein kinase domain-containing protein n=1 Tax=Streptomyces sp. NPDC127172 TaxID=3345382 RepID=UPI003637F137